jgi:hypothetical protein
VERSRLELVAGNAGDELRAADWIVEMAQLLDNDVVFLPACKNEISLLFQWNVRLESTPRVQPSVAMHRDPAMRRSGCVDFVWADVPISDNGTVTSDGLANIKKAIKQAEGLLKARIDHNKKHPPKS